MAVLPSATTTTTTTTTMNSPTTKKPIKKRMVVCPTKTEEEDPDPVGEATAAAAIAIATAARVDEIFNAPLAHATSAIESPSFSNDNINGNTNLQLPPPSSSSSSSVPTTTQVPHPVEETPEFIATILGALEVSLDLLPKSDRRALDRAIFFKPSLLSDNKFKLIFLRADRYDPQKAAKRIARHFEEKLLLFGESRLTKKITLEDLKAEDIKNLGSVGYGVLPFNPTENDRGNVDRPVWLLNIPNFNNSEAEPDSVCRCTWYQIMATGELSVAVDSDSNNHQEQDQMARMMKGVMDVVYCPGILTSSSGKHHHRKSSIKPSSSSSEIVIRNAKMIEGLPCRISKYHFCYDDPRTQTMISSKLGNIDVCSGGQKQHQEEKDMSLFTLTKTLQSIKQETLIRTICGTSLDLHYATMPSLGVLYWFNCDADVSMLLKNCYIQRRKAMERKDKELRSFQEGKGIILHPQPDDVLVGRGRPYQDYPGNQRLGYYVETNLTKYKEASSRFEKSCIIIDVVQSVQHSGGRFIQKCTSNGGSWWVVASDKAAREKTCSAFRTKICKRQQAAASVSASASASGGGGGAADKKTNKKNNLTTSQPHNKSTKRLRLDPS